MTTPTVPNPQPTDEVVRGHHRFVPEGDMTDLDDLRRKAEAATPGR